MSSCIGLVYFQSWIKTTASRLSYELGVNGEKESMEIGKLLIKMGKISFILVNLETLIVYFKRC